MSERTRPRRRGPSGAARICAAALLAWSALSACLPVGTAQEPAGKDPKRLPTTLTSGGVVMVCIPAGEFEMGSRDGEVDEQPVHKVRLDAFFMDQDFLTQAEYERLLGQNPSRQKDRPSNPVEQVTWAQAAQYCNARSREEGREPCYDTTSWRCDVSKNGYRLPTEAEWEYACRAGTRTKWHFGDKPEMLQVHAWYKANSGKQPRPVGRKTANPWGLYDMGGNLWQWCDDYYQADGYKSSPERNPRGPQGGDYKVVRGGSWNSDPDDCRSSARFKENPAFVRACFGRNEYGFRCVRNAPSSERAGAETCSAPASQASAAPPTQPDKIGKTGLVYGDIYLEHKVAKGHIETPQRLTAIIERLKQQKMYDRLVLIEPRRAEVEWLTGIHDPQYVKRARAACERGDSQLDCPDVSISARSYDAAIAAVGGVMAAVDAVMSGQVDNVFCALRPPGHHALRNEAMGFCIFNNVAVAARYIQKKHRLSRVLIVDWDVHHGNGTQAAFYDDPTVLYFSAHRSPFYPGTGSESEKGAGKGEGFTVNVELAVGATDADHVKAFRDKLLPAAQSFKPDFVLVSAGFDAHESDPLGKMKVTAKGYAELTRLVKGIADRHAHGRLVTVLEGGYDPAGLAASVEAHLGALME